MEHLAEALLRCMDEPSPQADGGWSCRFTPDEHFPGFAGHFPGHPVLPAVVQIRMARLLLERAAGREILLAGIPQAKFLRPIVPDTVIRVCVVPGRQKKTWDCVLTIPDGIAAQFRIQEQES